MIDEKLIEKFYSKLFTIPRKRITVSIGLGTILLASLLNGTVSKTFFAQRYFFIGLSLIVFIFIANRALKMALNSRRIFFLSLFILIFVETFDFIAIHVLNRFNLIIMAPATMAAGLTLILYFTSESSEIRTASLSALILIAIYPVDFFFSFEAPHRFLAYLTTIFVGIIFAFIFIKYIDRNYEEFNLKRLLRSFLLFWLTSNPDYFEKELLKTSKKRKGWVKCLKIGDVSLFTTSFHPGPLRNVGGALMVGKILEKFENSIYLHSPVKHESNPTSGGDVERILEAIDGLKFKNFIPLEPLELEGDNFSLKILPFDGNEGLNLIFISGKKAIDDIPPTISEDAEKHLGSCIVIDCHNCHRENYTVDEEDLDEIRKLLVEAKGKFKRKATKLNYSFHRQKIETQNTCGFIAVLTLDYGQRYCLVMLDGNNIDCDFKKSLEDYLHQRGFRAIVLSTDNHAKTAISPKVGYVPIGRDKKEREVIFSFIKDSLKSQNTKEARIAYGMEEVEINVMGDDFFSTVERAFKEVGERAMYLFFAVIILQLVVSLFLGSLIL
jgi:putative membrane protein